jgi:hypothetical protein
MAAPTLLHRDTEHLVERHHWRKRILDELARLQHESNPPRLVLLNDLAVSMLDGCNSSAGVTWLEALDDLERSGVIRIDAAGYITRRQTFAGRHLRSV